MWNNLRFFNGLDSEIQLVQDASGIWRGNVYLPEVSTQLYETVNLFILEECLLDNDTVVNTPIAPTSELTHFDFSWAPTEVGQSEDIIMYGMKMEGGKAIVKELKQQSIELDDYTSIITQDDNYLKTIHEQDNVAVQVNIAINSNKEGIHRRVLNISAGDNQVAEIAFYGEVEAEDERLKVLLANFGATLDEADFMLFKSHDISEMSPDQILLNQKRKELLLELHNIKPFVGTYKAVLNAIDFFGYDKITLKEYWININNSSNSFGKLHAIPVPNSSVRGEATRKLLKFKLPSATQKKTSRFSLVYRLNEPNGTFDVWDIPNVEETFDYTPEEVLIKLYGLKNKLQREYLPLQAKIVDITGEGDYFTQRNINMWKIHNPIGYFSEGHKIKWSVFPEGRDIFIEDLAEVLRPSLESDFYQTDAREQSIAPTNNYYTYLNLAPGKEATLTESNRAELRQVYEEFYRTYHDRELNSWNSNVPIGAPVILDGMESFDHTWDDAEFVWDDARDANDQLKVTWDNWWKKWVYEIEWLIWGPNDWHKTYRGPIDDFVKLPLILPHDGKYTIEMRTYDLFGHMSFYRIKDQFEVKLKELELYGIYEWLETKDSKSTTWNQKELDWNKSGGYWDFPQDNMQQVDDNIATLYLTLDRANYVHFEDDQGLRFSTVSRYVDVYSETGYSETTGPYQWDACKFRWKDTEHNWWDAMRVGSDLTASFKIDWIQQGDTLRITHRHPKTNELLVGQHIIQSTTPVGSGDIPGWNAIKAELEASNDPIISKFNYNPVFEDIDNDDDIDISDRFRFMLCVGQEYSKTYDFESVEIIKQNAGSPSAISGEVHVKHYNPTWDNVRVFRGHAEVERSTHVTISTDISKFPGAKNPTWTIRNITNPEITDIYYNNMWLTYIFQEPGDYEIQLEAEDTYNNKNVVRRNMIKVK